MAETTKLVFWPNAKNVINNSGLSLAAVARGSGIDPSSLRRMMAGKVPSRRSTAVSVIQFLNEAKNLGLQIDTELVPGDPGRRE